jgi:hypothetical protein
MITTVTVFSNIEVSFKLWLDMQPSSDIHKESQR